MEEDRLPAVVKETVLYLSDKVEGRPSSKDNPNTLKRLGIQDPGSFEI